MPAVVVDTDFEKKILVLIRNTIREEVARAIKEEMQKYLPEHLNKKEACKVLKVSLNTLNKLIKEGHLSLNPAGRIPYIQILKLINNENKSSI
ncbi:MAG: hypothetical protein AB1304_02975 [Bacteroidota bacterium]